MPFHRENSVQQVYWNVPVVTFYTLTTLCLLSYLFGANRYNGGDYYVYLDAVSRAVNGLSPYRFDKAMSFHYLPPTLVLFRVLSWLPIGWQHFTIALLTYLALLRITILGLKIFSPRLQPSLRPVLAIAPWIVLHQGIAAQMESGNVNLILVALSAEGLFRYLQDQKRVGAFLLMLPALFKPQLILPAYFVFLRDLRSSFAPFVAAGVAMVFLMTVPCLWMGHGSEWYLDWWKANSAHTVAILDNVAVSVNCSLFSFGHHIAHLPVSLLWKMFGVLFLAVHVPVIQQRSMETIYGLAMIFVFLFFPASFPYSLLLLFLPTCHALSDLLTGKRSLGGVLFLIGIMSLNLNLWGRQIFRDYIVDFRLSSWLMVPYFLVGLRGAILPLNEKAQAVTSGL